MDKNTVLLDLFEYNKLREFKEKIEENNSIKKEYWLHGHEYVTYISTDSHIKELIEEGNKLRETTNDLEKKISHLEDDILKLNKKLPIPIVQKDVTLEDIKKMSYWEFRRWKKTK